MNKSLLISTSHFGTINSDALERLEKEGFNITLNPYNRLLDSSESIELLKGKTALIAGTEKLTEEIFSQCGDLKYVCRFGTGIDSVDLEAAGKYGITVENLPEVHVTSVAELTLGGILSTLRRLPYSDISVKTGNWEKSMGSLLAGKRIGLVGLGKIAKALVPLLKPFEIEIMVHELYPDRNFIEKHDIKLVGLNKLCSDSQILTLHIPYKKENHHIIGSGEINLFRKDIVVINTSRGGLIDETALSSFLADNPEAYAYLDTMSKEPYSGPLTSLKNVFFSPHIGTFTRETRLRMELESAKKTIRFFNSNG